MKKIGKKALLTPSSVDAANEKTTKLVGYLPCYRSIENINDTVDFEKISHINYFSLEPMSDGTLRFTSGGSEAQLKEIITKAHEANTKVSVAIGGWGLSSGFSGATSQANIDRFVNNIIDFVDTYNLDGVDIDWEYPSSAEAQNFVNLMKKLNDSLGDKLLTVCVPSGVDSDGNISGQWQSNFPSEGLDQADWINIMAYDAQTPSNSVHSPFEIVENSLKYWDTVSNPGQNDMDKLVVGVPFYARSQWNDLMYRDILRANPNAIHTDIFNDGSGNYYYNGGETLTRKMNKALELNSGGLMIWELTQDASLSDPNNRLTNVINQAISDNGYVLDKGNTSVEPDNEKPTVPTNLISTNQTSSTITLSWDASTGNVGIREYEIYRDNIKVGTSSNTFYTDTNLKPLTSYTYHIRAVDRSGNISENSSSKTVSTTEGQQYTEWNPNSQKYVMGDIVTYNGGIYECIQDHESNAGWTPSFAITLWKKLNL